MMSRFFYCEIFVYFCVIFGQSLGKIPNYECREGMEAIFCKLSYINRTSSDKHFKVIPHLATSEINRAEILDSTMEILTEDVCDALPYVTYFAADNIGLIGLQRSAFEKCTKLEVIHLKGNSLKILPSKIFDSNTNLLQIWLSQNEITTIDANLFKNNQNLNHIGLDTNKLEKFSFSTEMPIMKKLTTIYLSHNKLFEVDIETLLEKCPNLLHFWFDGNQFTCDRQKTIIGALDAKNIKNWSGICIGTLSRFQNKGSKATSVFTILSFGLGVCWLIKKI